MREMKIPEKLVGHIVTTLIAIEPQLPAALQRLARNIIKCPDAVIASNLADIAKASRVGEATVVRLAKVLHYPGFKEFQIELAMELAGKSQREHEDQILDANIHEDDSCLVAAKKLKLSISRSLDENIRHLEDQSMHVVAESIYKARKVFIIGVGNSCLSALFLKNKLSRIGIDAQAESMIHFVYSTLAMLTTSDVVIAISQRGRSYETCKAFEIGKETGALCVAITNNPSSKIAQLADITLFNGNEEGLLQGDSAATIAAQLHICELIYVRVVACNNTKAAKTKQLTLRALYKDCTDIGRK